MKVETSSKGSRCKRLKNCLESSASAKQFNERDKSMVDELDLVEQLRVSSRKQNLNLTKVG